MSFSPLNVDPRYMETIEVGEEDSQLEIIYSDDTENPAVPDQVNSKWDHLTDYEIDEKLKSYQGHLRDVPVADPGKLRKTIDELQRLKQSRKDKKQAKQPSEGVTPEAKAGGRVRVNGGFKSAPTSSFEQSPPTCSKTDCSGGWNIDDNDTLNVFQKKGKLSGLPLSHNTESSFYGHKDGNRISSGQLAGPSPRQGLRSSSKMCNCKRRHGTSSPLQVDNGNSCDVCSNDCQKASKLSDSLSGKELPNGISSPGTVLGRRGRGGKRARQGVEGEESLDTVVELFSSEDEEDNETRETFADCNVSNQRKVYGMRSTVALSMAGVKIAYPSRDDPEAVEVLHHDLLRLEPLEFLNDTVIDFYIKYIQRPEVLTKDNKNKFYFFNSFFYKKLSEIVGAQNKKHVADLSKLRKWTKGTNIFEKDYLFVPIHDKWHWSLAIVCHPGASSEDSGSERCILHLDSMSPGHKSTIVFRLLRSYLLAEWGHQSSMDGADITYPKLSSEDFNQRKVQVPQQENESDCGLFLLHYIECFLKEAPSSFKLSDIDHNKLFGRNWFKPSEASGLRRVIQELLETLFIEAVKGTGNTETIERVYSQHSISKSQLQMGPQQSSGSDDKLLEITELGHSPDHSSPTEPAGKDIPETTLANLESPSTFSTAQDLQVEFSEQNVHKSLSRINDDMRASSSAIHAEGRNQNGLPGVPRSWSSAHRESCVECGARNKCQRIGSPDDNREMDVLLQLKSLGKDLEDDSQNGLHLVVDLPIDEEQLAAEKSIRTAGSDTIVNPGELSLVDTEEAGTQMDYSE